MTSTGHPKKRQISHQCSSPRRQHSQNMHRIICPMHHAATSPSFCAWTIHMTQLTPVFLVTAFSPAWRLAFQTYGVSHIPDVMSLDLQQIFHREQGGQVPEKMVRTCVDVDAIIYFIFENFHSFVAHSCTAAWSRCTPPFDPLAVSKTSQ